MFSLVGTCFRLFFCFVEIIFKSLDILKIYFVIVLRLVKFFNFEICVYIFFLYSNFSFKYFLE